MSHKLINNSITNRSKILNLNTSQLINNLELNKNYIGNFKVYKYNTQTNTFEISDYNNVVIEVNSEYDYDNNNILIVGYQEIGTFDYSKNQLINKPFQNISNIGYIKYENDKFIGHIRAGVSAGKGAIETWEIENGDKIISYYSLNGNTNNEPVQFIGTFEKFVLP